MTETEWLDCTDPTTLLHFLDGKFPQGRYKPQQGGTDRKLLLFTCACCRRIWHLLRDERSRRAVEVTERYVDGLASAEEFHTAIGDADQAWRDFEENYPDRDEYIDRADSCARWAAYYLDFPDWGSRKARLAMIWEKAQQGIHHQVAEAQEEAQQCRFLRDLFGNPFRPVVLEPSWQTPDVVTLAGHIYHDRAFELMQELADVLEDAGCGNAAIVNHCRLPEEHIPGCWVIDLLLDKS